jgi:AmmeMemoRadiSam system protein A
MYALIALAKKTVEIYIKEGKIIEPEENLIKEFSNKKAGVFITIEKNKDLRGCIGTYLPTRDNIIEEVIQNAVSASTEDYRFGPIQEQELPFLSYTVSILEKPELIKDKKELNPKEYGIIVKTIDYPPKSALLLPDLEGIDTIEKQISITCQKGNINPSKEKITIYRFKIKKYE